MLKALACVFILDSFLYASEAWGLAGLSLRRLDGRAPSLALPWRANDFALSRTRSMLLLRGSCLNETQELWRRTTQGRMDRIRLPQERLPRWGRSTISNLTISQSGLLGAFVVRPCHLPQGIHEAADEVGIVFVVDLLNLKVQTVVDSVDDSGYPRGVAMVQGFSPDERFLLVNYEGGFTIFEISTGRGMVGDDALPEVSNGQLRAAGWLTNKCLVIQSVRNGANDFRTPSYLFFWREKPSQLTDSLLPLNLHTLAFPLALFPGNRDWEVVSLLDGSLISRIMRTNVRTVHLVDDSTAKVECSEFVKRLP